MEILKKKKKWQNYSGCVNILGNLKDSDIPKIIAEDRIHLVQFFMYRNPSKRTWRVLNNFFRAYPNIGLRIAWNDTIDFGFYEFIPYVRRISIDSFYTQDYTPLLSNLNLHHLGIGETKSSAVDLSFIREFKVLESLYVDGMKKGLNNISYLNLLKKLTLRGVKLDNLDFLSELKYLQELNLRFGSYKNLDSLVKLKNIKSIEFSRVRQIPNFDFLNGMNSLEVIEFEGMSKLEVLPNFDQLHNLKKLQIRNNLRLRDIHSIKTAPNLQAFIISFAENSKAIERKNLIDQTVNALLKSDSIRYSNIMYWTDEATTLKLKENGVEPWKWDIEL